MEKKKTSKKDFDIYKFIIPALLLIIVLLVIVIIEIYDKKDDHLENYPNNNSNYTTNKNNIDNSKIKITNDEALNIALNDLKITNSDIFDIEIEIENKFGSVVYEITFNSGVHEYEYYIDATTGDILHSYREIDY